MSSFTAKEWDASGAIFSYGKMDLRCFVVEVVLSEDVRGDLLQAAVDKALVRLPYYRQTLVRKKGLYYYANNDLPFVVGACDEARWEVPAPTITWWTSPMRHARCALP